MLDLELLKCQWSISNSSAVCMLFYQPNQSLSHFHFPFSLHSIIFRRFFFILLLLISCFLFFIIILEFSVFRFIPEAQCEIEKLIFVFVLQKKYIYGQTSAFVVIVFFRCATQPLPTVNSTIFIRSVFFVVVCALIPVRCSIVVLSFFSLHFSQSLFFFSVIFLSISLFICISASDCTQMSQVKAWDI